MSRTFRDFEWWVNWTSIEFRLDLVRGKVGSGICEPRRDGSLGWRDIYGPRLKRWAKKEHRRAVRRQGKRAMEQELAQMEEQLRP